MSIGQVQTEPEQESVTLALNMLYTNRRTKFKVSSLLQRETQHDIDQTHQMVHEDRKMFIQVKNSMSEGVSVSMRE